MIDIVAGILFPFYVLFRRVQPLFRKESWVTQDAPETQSDDLKDRKELEALKRRKQSGSRP